MDNIKKVEPLPVYQSGVSPVLSSSVSTVAPSLADTNTSVIVFSWTDPKYATSLANTKYVLEIDSTGKSFGVENTKTVEGVLSASLTGRELNALLLNLGFKIGVTQTIDVVLFASYLNNNEKRISNIITIKVTTFPRPVDPEYAKHFCGMYFAKCSVAF